MDYKKELKKAKEYAEKCRLKNEISDIRNKYKKSLPTHKLVTIYLFVVLNIVLVYSLVAMWNFADLTHLGLLITDIMGQILTFIVYSHHSISENKEGSLKYSLTMKERNEESVG